MLVDAKSERERHSDWRAKVRRYVGAGDRGEEPCFVGRGELFDLVDLMAETACAGQRDSRTIVIGGAPGAGKTAFVRELAKRRSNGGAVVVELRPGEMRPFRLFEEVAKAVDAPTQERRNRTTATVVEGSLGVAKGQTSRTTTTVTPGDRESLRDGDAVPWDLLRERFGGRLTRDSPLFVLCDEAQNLVANATTNVLLDSLHRGDPDHAAPIPVVPVFAGLSSTGDVLGRCGITRPGDGNVRSISALSGGESKEYALKTLTHLDAEASQGDKVRWADWFADTCDGWPQHLRIQMSAVAEEMLRADSPSLHELDGARIAQAASAARNRYYGRRLQATRYPILAPVMQSVAAHAGPDGAALDDLAAKATQLLEERQDSPTAETLLLSAIHAGILQQTERPDRYVCPIPSMRLWLGTREHVVPPPPTCERGLVR